MIVYLRFKVRRLLHRYVVPGLCATFLAMTAAGCLFAAAASQSPNRGSVYPDRGENRTAVIEAFGQPDSVEHVNGKEVDVYKSDPNGFKPGERGQLVLILLLDVCTFGIPGSAMVLAPFGERNYYDVYSITYSSDDKVESVSAEKKKSRFVGALGLWDNDEFNPQSPCVRGDPEATCGNLHSAPSN